MDELTREWEIMKKQCGLAVEGLRHIENVTTKGAHSGRIARDTLARLKDDKQKGGDAKVYDPDRLTDPKVQEGGREGDKHDVDWELLRDVIKTGDDTRYGKELCKAAIQLKSEQSILKTARTALAALAEDQGKQITKLKDDFADVESSMLRDGRQLPERIEALEKRVPTADQVMVGALRAVKRRLVEKQRYDEAAKIREVIRRLEDKDIEIARLRLKEKP